MADWIQASRLRGVLRYHWKIIGRIVLYTLLIVLGSQLISLVMPLLTGSTYPFDGIRANFEVVFFVALVAGIIICGRSTRFLLRFGTSRTAVWLGNVVGLLAGMIGLLCLTFLLNMTVAALLLPLSQWMPTQYAVLNSTIFAAELSTGLQNLPQLLLYTVEWTLIFHFYACMLRRFRGFTIGVSVGVPLLFAVLMLIPAVREAISVIDGANQSQLVLLGIKWIQIIQDIMQFVEEHWDALQLTAAITSLPLSYLLMRGTKQP